MQRILSSSARAVIAAALAVAIVAPAAVSPSAALASTATTTTIDAPVDKVPGTFEVAVHVRPSPYDPGAIGRCVSVDLDGANLICLPIDVNGDVSRQFTGVGYGTHTVHAAWSGASGFDASSAQADVVVGRGTTTTVSISTHAAVDTELVTLTATVTPTSGAGCGGTFTFRDASAGGPVGTVAVNASTGLATLAHRFAIGTHSITGTYNGYADCEPSNYTDYEMLTVTDDKAVSVSGLRLGYATFYPVKDGYRDTLAVRGTLGERARVVIRVRNAAHTLVRTKDLGVRAAGPYSWSWNGRNDGGVLLPAGTYTVSQRVTDTPGNGLSWKDTVNLSRKSLHWTSQTITKTGDQFGLSWDPGDGWISTAKSPYADGVRLRSSGDLVGVRYTFRLHSGVAYSGLTFRILGRSPNGLVGLAGLWNAVNAADNPKAFAIRGIGPSYRWWSMAFSSARRSGTLTYGMVMAPASPSTTFDVARVQLVYRYAILQ